MELQIRPHHHVLNSIQEFFKPFTAANLPKEKESFIMPLSLVEKTLHDHYVTMQPLDITYEFYNDNQHIELGTIRAVVESTVQPERYIAIKDVTDQRTMFLSLEQILTVSANAA